MSYFVSGERAFGSDKTVAPTAKEDDGMVEAEAPEGPRAASVYLPERSGRFSHFPAPVPTDNEEKQSESQVAVTEPRGGWDHEELRD